LWFSFADLSRIIALASGHRFPAHAFQKQGRFRNHPIKELCQDRARVILTLGRMMFQSEQAGNGEGLKNRVFTCTPNLLKSLVLLTVQEGM